MPQAFLGGRMSLDIARAERALGKLARQLRLDLQRTAEGVVRVVNAGMERAIRRISVERGHDPREYVLLSFGGAGGMHACELAAALDMRRVLVPYHPGLLSARGAASAGVQRDYVQTVRLVDPSAADIERRLALLLRQARREMREEGRELGTARRAALAVFLDVRYRGQSYEIRVPFRRNFAATFHALHERLYGYADRARPIEVVNLRLIASIPGPKLPRHRVDGRHVAPQPHRLLWGGRWLKADCYPRDCLPANRRFAGPLVITEFSATTVVAPGWTARAFDDGDLLLERR
jgi:N-methylhydantoinase A